MVNSKGLPQAVLAYLAPKGLGGKRRKMEICDAQARSLFSGVLFVFLSFFFSMRDNHEENNEHTGGGGCVCAFFRGACSKNKNVENSLQFIGTV